jgi:hypothetical protein
MTLLALSLSITIGLVPQAFPADPPGPAPTTQTSQKPAANAHRPSERQRKAYIGLAALAGIIISGVALAAFIILWGGRLRRQLRRPPPDCELPARDFWFLKPPKPLVRDSSLPESHLPSHDAPQDP